MHVITTKGNSIVRRKGNRWLNFDKINWHDPTVGS